jgi:uncharacterized membrane protein YkoI
MTRNFLFVFILGLALGLTTFSNGASAKECGGRKQCDQGSPIVSDQDSASGRFMAQGRAKQRRKFQRRRPQAYENDEPSYYSDDVFVQSGNDRGQLIGPTEALTQALSVVPGGKALGVKLLKGQKPVYAVKMRVGGQVRRVLVDARTGQILGE